MALQNKWYLRTVAENAGKACWIDYKTTSSVLITPDSKDFFYVCRGHLKDRTFCTPAVPPEDAEATAAKKREEEIQKEIEAIKKEYADKQAAKKKDKKDKKAEEAEQKSDEKERDDKIKAVTEQSGSGNTNTDPDDLPRIYSLHRNFFQMRLDRIKSAEMARRNRERLKDPDALPSVPTGDLS